MPAEQAAGLVDALLHLYQVKAESLYQRAGELIRGEASADSLRSARDELASLDRTIEQLGWDPSGRDGPVELSADGPLLREATLVAIDEAGDRLSTQCTALLRGEGSAAPVAAELETLRGLLDLLPQ